MSSRTMPLLMAGLLSLLVAADAQSQKTGPDVRKYITMIDQGKTDQVKAELPALLSQYPNDPGVLYLQGLTTTDGAEAVRIYQSIVDNFPKSEWADKALFKVYQFYYALGLYRTADMKMAQLKKDYPESPFARQGGEAAEAPKPDTAQVHVGLKPVDTTAAAPAPAVQEAPPLRYVLQVGAYTVQVNAEKQKLFFEDLGYPVEVLSSVKQGRSLFLVLVGNFSSYDEAKVKGTDIKKKYNINSFVISR